MTKWAPAQRPPPLVLYDCFECHYSCFVSDCGHFKSLYGHFVSLCGHFEVVLHLFVLILHLCDFQTTNVNSHFMQSVLRACVWQAGTIHVHRHVHLFSMLNNTTYVAQPYPTAWRQPLVSMTTVQVTERRRSRRILGSEETRRQGTMVSVPATQDSSAYAMLGQALSAAVLFEDPTTRASAGTSSARRLELVPTLPQGTQPTWRKG